MTLKEKLQNKLDLLTQQKNSSEKELDNIEKEFADVKLNPYGITSIDFSKRQELTSDILKMEGAIMGLTLALELIEEPTENA